MKWFYRICCAGIIALFFDVGYRVKIFDDHPEPTTLDICITVFAMLCITALVARGVWLLVDDSEKIDKP